MVRFIFFFLSLPWIVWAKQPEFTPIPPDRLSLESKESLSNVYDYLKDKKKDDDHKNELRKKEPITLQRGSKLTADEPSTIVTPTEEQEVDAPKTVTKPGLKLSISTQESSIETTDLTLQDAFKAAAVGQTEAGISLYRNVLQLQPDNVSALYGLAVIYQNEGVYSEAHHYYARILSLEPDNQDALNNFLVLIGGESPSSAIEELKKLEMLDPHLSLIPAQIAMMYARLEDVHHAVQYFNKALLLNPKEDSYRYNLAVFLDKHERPQEAMKHYVQVLRNKHNRKLPPKTYERINERLIYLGQQ